MSGSANIGNLKTYGFCPSRSFSLLRFTGGGQLKSFDLGFHMYFEGRSNVPTGIYSTVSDAI